MTHIQPCEVVYMQQLRQRINDALKPGLNGTFAGSIDPVVPLLNQFEDKQGMPIMLLIESDKYDSFSRTPEYVVAFILQGFRIPDIEQATVLYAPNFDNWFIVARNWYEGGIDVGDEILKVDNPKCLEKILKERYTLVNIQMPETKDDWKLCKKLCSSCEEVWGPPSSIASRSPVLKTVAPELFTWPARDRTSLSGGDLP